MMIAKNQSILKITLNFLIYFFPLTFVLGNLVTNAVVVLITILGFLALLKNSIKIKFNLIIILTFLFSICILIVSITNSINIDKAFLFLRYPLFALIVYNLFLNFEFNKNKIILFYSLIILIVSLDIMIQYFFGYNITGFKPPEFGANYVAYTGFFKDEKIAESFILTFCFFLIYSFFNNLKFNKNKELFIEIIVWNLIAFSILFSLNRMSFFLFLFGSILSVIFLKKKLKSFFVSIIFFLSLLYLLDDDFIKGRYGGFFDNLKTMLPTISKHQVELSQKQNSEETELKTIKSGHAYVFSSAIKVWKNNIYFGVGIKNYVNNCTKVKNSLCSTHPHNYYLDIATSGGTVSLILIFTIVILIIKEITKIILKNKNENMDLSFLYSLVICFIIIFFPIRSSGGFFTTSNASYNFFILSLLISEIDRIKILYFFGGRDKN